MGFQDSIKEAIRLHEQLLNDGAFLVACRRAEEIIVEALLTGKKVLVAGNGGSAAHAQHFAAEFMATLKKEERNGYPVLALTTDTSFLTAWTNDFGYKDVFARQVKAWGKEGDVFLGISTSGNSKNVVGAAEVAQEHRLSVIGLLGGEGGTLKEKCTAAIVVPSSSTARIQEVHTLTLHMWCENIIPCLS